MSLEIVTITFNRSWGHDVQKDADADVVLFENISLKDCRVTFRNHATFGLDSVVIGHGAEMALPVENSTPTGVSLTSVVEKKQSLGPLAIPVDFEVP